MVAEIVSHQIATNSPAWIFIWAFLYLQGMSWQVIPTDEAVHVVPLDDKGGHLLEECCPCHPRRDKTNSGGLMLIHDAYDGRVGVEWAEDILK